jgi:HSP20 family molecular chaperone IbpA
MKKLYTLLVVSQLGLSANVYAADNINANYQTLENKIKYLEEKINLLENRRPFGARDPFMDFDKMWDNHNRLMNQVFNNMEKSTFKIERDDSAIKITANLAEFNKDEIDISVNNYVLIIKANKENKDASKDTDKVAEKYTSASFLQKVSLPRNANKEKINTSFKDWELKIEIPLEKDEVKKIDL